MGWLCEALNLAHAAASIISIVATRVNTYSDPEYPELRCSHQTPGEYFGGFHLHINSKFSLIFTLCQKLNSARICSTLGTSTHPGLVLSLILLLYFFPVALPFRHKNGKSLLENPLGLFCWREEGEEKVLDTQKIGNINPICS